MLKQMRLNLMYGWCRKKPDSVSLWNPFCLITTTLPFSITSHYKPRWPITLPSNLATQAFQGLRIPTLASQNFSPLASGYKIWTQQSLSHNTRIGMEEGDTGKWMAAQQNSHSRLGVLGNRVFLFTGSLESFERYRI